LATKDDLVEIMSIIGDAKAFLKKSGSTQWQNGYPNEESILNDINNKNGYVLMVGDKVAGYAAVIAAIEPTYQ
jgi:phosphoglycolate phosphatase-like HAD superfamily hydrolase